MHRTFRSADLESNSAAASSVGPVSGRLRGRLHEYWFELALLGCAMLILKCYSGPRSIFATLSVLYATSISFGAKLGHPGSEERHGRGVRSSMALCYLGHWSADLLHLYLAEGTATVAVSIAQKMLAATPELALIFCTVTALLGADAGPSARTTLGRVVAAQAVLAMRACVVWRELARTATLDPLLAPWGDVGDVATAYLCSAMCAQIGLPLVTMSLSFWWARRSAGRPLHE